MWCLSVWIRTNSVGRWVYTGTERAKLRKDLSTVGRL